MKAKRSIAAFLVAALTTAALGEAIPVASATETDSYANKYADKGYSLTWHDEFDQSALNREDWNVELHNPGWVNNELQAYVDSADNIEVKNDCLYLTPIKEDGAAGANLLTNADFSDSFNGWGETIANWDDSVTADASHSINGGAITYNIKNPGTSDWHVQLQQEGISLTAGTTYHFSAKVTSTCDRKLTIGVVDTEYKDYGKAEPQLQANAETAVSFDFTPGKSDNAAKLQVNMGYFGEALAEHDVTISDITLTADSGESSYTSGRISTQNKQAFTYGIFECRARVPAGKGFLPAFWLMANDESIYGQWPRCGEIDCMEVMGQDTRKVYGTIHFGNPHSESQGTRVLTGEDSFSKDFHTFTCEWEPGRITWYVDGEKYHEESDWYSTTEGQGTLSYPAPFDQPFYIILNLAVGGSWVGYPDESTSFDNNPYVVDYVRVYQKDSYDENVTRPEKPFQPREADGSGNYINNGSFDVAEDLTDDVNWKFMLANGGDATATIDNNEITVATAAAGSVDYSVQLVQAGLPFQKGATYQVSFDARAAGQRTMNVDIKAPDHGYKSYMPTKNPALTGVKSDITKKMSASWRKVAGVSGYQLQCSIDKTFKAGTRNVTVQKADTISKLIGGLKSKSTYYVRIRSYQTISGKRVYSAWSTAKSVNVK